MKPRNWFTFTNVASDPTVAEIHIVDIIGDWIDEMINEYYGMKATVTAKAFIEQLGKLEASVTTIRVHINSPGGDVFAALNIANALRDQQTSKGRTVETVIDGLAASAASVIAMAGKKVTMADNALFMVHNPWSFAMGDANAMRAAADTLDTVRNTLVATYKWHSSLSNEDIIALLDAESWLDATQAKEKGFVTDTVNGLQAAASIDARAITALKVPEQFKARVAAFLKQPEASPVAATAKEILRACNAAGCGELAESLVDAGATLQQVTAKVTETKATKERESARVTAIQAACTVAKRTNLAGQFVRDGLSIDAVRAVLTTMNAEIDNKVQIDGALPVDSGGRSNALINREEIFAARNASR